jgi:hypothetical protein
MQMKLYLLSQGENNGYDTYDSMVVAAESEDAARQMHPGNEWGWNVWANSPEQVDVEYLGEAAPESEAGVICASFNAG